MKQTMTAAPADSPSRLMGTLAIMGFAAEDNLRKVAQALAQRNPGELALVAERNAKQPRLRAEIEQQIVEESAHLQPTGRQMQKWRLVSHAAHLFERMGHRTVEIACACGELLREPRPGRVADIRKLLEHAVYITDRAATGLVEEDLAMVEIAQQQAGAARDLTLRIDRELAALVNAAGGSTSRLDLLRGISCRAREMIDEAACLADDVVVYLNTAGP